MKTINLGEKEPLVQMKVNDLIKFGNENNHSDRSILKTATLIRRVFGRKSVEENLEKTLPQMKNDMSDFIDVKQVETVRQRKGMDTDHRGDSSSGLCYRLQEVLCQGNG